MLSYVSCDYVIVVLTILMARDTHQDLALCHSTLHYLTLRRIFDPEPVASLRVITSYPLPSGFTATVRLLHFFSKATKNFNG